MAASCRNDHVPHGVGHTNVPISPSPPEEVWSPPPTCFLAQLPPFPQDVLLGNNAIGNPTVCPPTQCGKSREAAQNGGEIVISHFH